MVGLNANFSRSLMHSALHMFQERWSIQTSGRGFTELTDDLQHRTRKSGIQRGNATVFLEHTSASLILCENADPTVRADLETVFGRLAPDGDPMYRHAFEGPDDMPAHIRTVLTQNSLVIPIIDSRLSLGTWQGIYLWEHRYQPHHRWLSLTIMGQRCVG